MSALIDRDFIDLKLGYFRVKTLHTQDELRNAFLLRHLVFFGNAEGLDQDEFDESADHLGIFDERTFDLVATCRLNSSLRVSRFYSSQEFDCETLLSRPGAKLEIGRVCVHEKYRRGTVILMLWRAIGEYLLKSKSEILFGCGSVMTQSPQEAWILMRYLEAEQKLRLPHAIFPVGKYRFAELDALLKERGARELTTVEHSIAKALLPPLCQSYFDIGCYVAGPPALDTDFKCIDFLTILEVSELNPRIRKKMLGFLE